MRMRKTGLAKEELNDLGFGAKVTQNTKRRLLDRDGSFNVKRRGQSFLASLHLYHALLNMPWWHFHLVIVSGFLGVNALFALLYILAGPEAVGGAVRLPLNQHFAQAFFFSVQTFTSVGYGQLTPNGLTANVIATADAFFGLLSFAFATGLVFARFARPTAKIIFSRVALVAPYREITGFQFRIANERNNQLVDLHIRVLFSRLETVRGRRIRTFDELELERKQVVFFPLHWTIVHPIDEQSPLAQYTETKLRNADAEFLILLTAFDETFSQTVHARSSYKFDEVIWGAKFRSMLDGVDSGRLSVDLRNLHAFDSNDSA